MAHRIRWTHTIRVERPVSAETDAYGSPTQTGTELVLENEPVRYQPGGTEYVRGETGERVRTAPTVTGRDRLSVIREGDSITLEPSDTDADAIEGVEVVSINETYGRGARSALVSIELEDI